MTHIKAGQGGHCPKSSEGQQGPQIPLLSDIMVSGAVDSLTEATDRSILHWLRDAWGTALPGAGPGQQMSLRAANGTADTLRENTR